MGRTGLEPVTPALSRRCSNQLSYRPKNGGKGIRTPDIQLAKLTLYQLSYTPKLSNSFKSHLARQFLNSTILHRKEVIQPQVPLRLPCYDFIPVTGVSLVLSLLAVNRTSLGNTSFHDVTGGVYKTRERIHDAVADASLLAIPTSCRRVAAYNLN
jgi:hypothetical protein